MCIINLLEISADPTRISGDPIRGCDPKVGKHQSLYLHSEILWSFYWTLYYSGPVFTVYTRGRTKFYDE